jgi:hypothetical protein
VNLPLRQITKVILHRCFPRIEVSSLIAPMGKIHVCPQ